MKLRLPAQYRLTGAQMSALGSPQHFPQLCQDISTPSGKEASPHGCLVSQPPPIFPVVCSFPTFQPQDLYFSISH